MKRCWRLMLHGVLMLCVVLIVGCGPAKLPESPGGFLSGPKVEVQQEVEAPEPWLLEWTGDARLAIAAQLAEGIALVRYEAGVLTMLPNCSLAGAYAPGTARGRPRDTQSITSEAELYAALDIKIAKAGARFDQGKAWHLDYVVADVRSSDRPAPRRGELTAGCERATHYVSRAYFGAYVLNTEAKRSGGGEATIPVSGVDIKAGGGGGSRAELARKDGEIETCANHDTPSDAAACQGILKIGIVPLED